MALGLELAAQLGVVLDDAVEDDVDAVRRSRRAGGRSPRVTRPWVAQRVCARPIVAGGAATATAPGRRRRRRRRARSRRAGWRGCRPPAPSRPGRRRAARCRPSRSRGTRASRAPRSAGRGRAACPRIRRFRTCEAIRVERRPGRRSGGATRAPAAITASQPRADLVALGLRGRLDHHPDERLGARGADQHAAAALERARSRARPPPRPRSRRSSASRSATSTFRAAAAASASGSRRRGRRSPSARIDQQRRGDPVAGRPVLAPDDVAGLLAAERPAALARAPRSRGGRRPGSSPPRSRPRPSPGGSRSCSSPSRRRRRRAAPASREVPGAEGDQLVAVANRALGVHRDHPVAVAVEGEADLGVAVGRCARPAARGGWSRSPR